MATLSINLPITSDFVKPSLLINASAETCVNVLLAGVAAVECANETISTATNASLTAKLTSKYEAQISRAQKDTEAERMRLQKEIERLQADTTLAKSLRADAESRLSEATANARQQAYDDAEERIRKAVEERKKAEEKAADSQSQLMAAVIAEKKRAEDLVNAERARSDKAIEEKNRTIEVLQGISTSSSQKGGVYEQKIKYCVVNAFGTANKFDILDKLCHSGVVGKGNTGGPS